jgi:hypothetical protein
MVRGQKLNLQKTQLERCSSDGSFIEVQPFGNVLMVRIECGAEEALQRFGAAKGKIRDSGHSFSSIFLTENSWANYHDVPQR